MFCLFVCLLSVHRAFIQQIISSSCFSHTFCGPAKWHHAELETNETMESGSEMIWELLQVTCCVILPQLLNVQMYVFILLQVSGTSKGVWRNEKPFCRGSVCILFILLLSFIFKITLVKYSLCRVYCQNIVCSDPDWSLSPPLAASCTVQTPYEIWAQFFLVASNQGVNPVRSIAPLCAIYWPHCERCAV